MGLNDRDGATECLDGLLGLCRYRVGGYLDFRRQGTRSKQLYQLTFAQVSKFGQHRQIDLGTAGALHQGFDLAEVERHVFNPVDVLETALGQPALHGRLSTLEIALQSGTTPRFVTLVATGRSPSPAGARSPAYALAVFDGTFCRTYIMEFHIG